MTRVLLASFVVAVAVALLPSCRSPHKVGESHVGVVAPFPGESCTVAVAPFPEAVELGFGNFEGEPFILCDPKEVKNVMVDTSNPRFSRAGQALDFIREVLAKHGYELMLRSKASPVYEVIRSRPKRAQE